MIKKAIVFIAVIWVAVKVSGAIGYGLITLVGMIALIESAPPLKWLVRRFTTTIDIILFILTIVATTTLGYNITASLVVAGVGYTLVYAPYVRREKQQKSIKPKYNPADKIDWS